MSSKEMINNLKLLIGSSGVSGMVMRDHVEVSQLQGSVKTCYDFAFASYKASFRNMVKKITSNISSMSDIQVEDFIPIGFVGDTEDHYKSDVVFKDLIPQAGAVTLGSVVGSSEIVRSGAVNGGTSFILTPLSGVELFARGLSGFSIGIGIVRSGIGDGKGVVSQGVVYDVMDDLFYSATLGMGAYCSRGYDIKIKTSAVSKLKYATVVVGGLDSVLKKKVSVGDKKAMLFLKKVQNLLFNVASCISTKNSELSLAHLSAGRVDLFVHIGVIDLKSIATSLLLAKESGVVFLNTDCEEVDLFSINKYSDGFIATTKSMLPEVLKFFRG